MVSPTIPAGFPSQYRIHPRGNSAIVRSIPRYSRKLLRKPADSVGFPQSPSPCTRLHQMHEPFMNLQKSVGVIEPYYLLLSQRQSHTCKHPEIPQRATTSGAGDSKRNVNAITC